MSDLSLDLSQHEVNLVLDAVRFARKHLDGLDTYEQELHALATKVYAQFVTAVYGTA